MLMNKLDDIKLELAKEYIQKGKITPALKLIKELIFEISYLNIKEQIELLNKLLDADINRKSYEYFFYRYIKPYISENERNTINSANALQGKEKLSNSLKSQNKSNKSAVALNKSVKEVTNEKDITKKLHLLKQTDVNFNDDDDTKNLV